MSSETTKAFVTGSYAYGIPRDDSDIDVVAYVSSDDQEQLYDVCLGRELTMSETDERYPNGVECFRFGRLNLIAIADKRQYDAWAVGTADLISRKPVTRDEAVATLKALGI